MSTLTSKQPFLIQLGSDSSLQISCIAYDALPPASSNNLTFLPETLNQRLHPRIYYSTSRRRLQRRLAVHARGTNVATQTTRLVIVQTRIQSHDGPDVPEGRRAVIEAVGKGYIWLIVGIVVILMVLSAPLVVQYWGRVRRLPNAVAGTADTQISSLYS